jgi:hypothetical protein
MLAIDPAGNAARSTANGAPVIVLTLPFSQPCRGFPSFLVKLHGKKAFSIENHRKRGKNQTSRITSCVHPYQPQIVPQQQPRDEN